MPPARRAYLGSFLLAVAGACGDPAPRVQLAPRNPCGPVTAKTGLRVVGYTGHMEMRRSVAPTETADISAFPDDTEQLGVEVIGESGKLVAIGKTAPLAFDALEDGARIPIVMAPPGGVCPVGPLTEPRHSPVVARAGELVLVVGGTGAAGEQLATAEVYDPVTLEFSPVSVPPSLMDPENGLAGAVLTELPDGRVALTGTSSHALAIFDPETRKFSAPNLFDHRAFHGAFGVADNRLLVIGGCADVVGGTCSGPNLRTGFVYDLTDVTMRERGPALDPTAVRTGARVFDIGEQQDGARRFVLAGGFGEPGAADRFSLSDNVAERVSGVHATATLLDGGAVLSASASAASVLAPGGSATSTSVPMTGLGSASLVTLEDGSVLAAGDTLHRYAPTFATWQPVDAGLPALSSPALARLADGSVLVLGGAATTDAWIYRPSLVGATTGDLVLFVDGSDDDVLTPTDLAATERAGALALVGGDVDDLHARVLVGGPRMSSGGITAVVRVAAGGVALIGQQTGPGHYLAGRLVPGEPARIIEQAGGTTTVLCSGPIVEEGELASAVGLSITGGTASITIGAAASAAVKVRCDVAASERGQWGLAAAGVGARLEVGPVTVTRSR